MRPVHMSVAQHELDGMRHVVPAEDRAQGRMARDHDIPGGTKRHRVECPIEGKHPLLMIGITIRAAQMMIQQSFLQRCAVVDVLNAITGRSITRHRRHDTRQRLGIQPTGGNITHRERADAGSTYVRHQRVYGCGEGPRELRHVTRIQPARVITERHLAAAGLHQCRHVQRMHARIGRID